MGDFSRNTFKLTNIIHQLITGETVPNPKQYVGVRLQQGVPLLDADWNELEDIRRMELMAMFRYFIGNGVPAGNRGFQILATSEDNNFSVGDGIILIEGIFVINSNLTTYSTQPYAAALLDLTTPADDRTDLVYLDTWEEEIGGTDDGDTRLIDNRIGIETALRIERKWLILVQEEATDLSSVTKENGHRYLALALINRRANVGSITPDMIVDLRKTGITLAENIKVPLFIQRGLETLNVSRFVQMLKGFRTSLFERLRSGQLPYQTDTPQNENIFQLVMQETMNMAYMGDVQTNSRNMDNQDAMNFMQNLYDQQKKFLEVLSEIGNVGNVAQDFIDDYLKYLDGSTSDFIKGLRLAKDNRDLLAAVIAQEELNYFLSVPTENLPEGDVFVIYKSAIPFEKLIAGSSYDFTFEVESGVANLPPSESEEFVIQTTISASSWTTSLDKDRITLQNDGGKERVKVTVIPNILDNQATLTVQTFAARNNILKSTQPGIDLKINEFPPVGLFLFYSGPRLNAQGRLEIPKPLLIGATGVPIRFSLVNSSSSENRTYVVIYYVVPDIADATGWSPQESNPQEQTFILPPNQPPYNFDIRIKGPTNVAPNTIGRIFVTATLTEIDGTSVSEGETATISINFIIITT